MKLRVPKARVKSTLSATRNKGRGVKEDIHSEGREFEVNPGGKGGGRYALIKAANGVTISMGFSSTRADVGIELPWEVSPISAEVGEEGSNRLKMEIAAGFDFAYQIIDDELSKRGKEMEDLIKKMSKKYAR